jgi:hypothetical protein
MQLLGIFYVPGYYFRHCKTARIQGLMVWRSLSSIWLRQSKLDKIDNVWQWPSTRKTNEETNGRKREKKSACGDGDLQYYIGGAPKVWERADAWGKTRRKWGVSSMAAGKEKKNTCKGPERVKPGMLVDSKEVSTVERQGVWENSRRCGERGTMG